MNYENTKIYFDGSHYIGIPHKPQPWKKRKIKSTYEDETLKELFEESFKATAKKKRKERNEEITKALKPYIKNEDILKEYVNKNLERKKRNLIERRKRLARKTYLQEWSYFCTFTYDDKKHTAETFRIKLANTLKHFSNRKSWKYIGVWEKSPGKQRLHFHSLVYVPEAIELNQKRDYSTKSHKMQITYESPYFLKRFGRNDFKPIDSHNLGSSIAYLMKYLEKTSEKIVYSKNLPTYFVSDILASDVACKIGQENRKLLLFDNFNCWKDGVLVGRISKETINQMPKLN